MNEWVQKLNDETQVTDALAALTRIEMHRTLRADLAQAGEIARAAAPLISQLSNPTDQLRAATLVYRYALTFDLWSLSLSWFKETLEYSQLPSQFLYGVILNGLIIVPDYQPYWDRAKQATAVMLKNYVETADPTTRQDVAREWLHQHGIAHTVRESQSPGDAVQCSKCGGMVSTKRALTADRKNWFCSDRCASAYYNTPHWGNPRNW